MRGLICRSVVALLALSFATSGVAASHCMAAQPPAPLSEAQAPAHDARQAHQSHDTSGMAHSGLARPCDEGAGHHAQPADPAIADDIACAKCCGTCTLANAVIPAAASPAVFVMSPAVFAARFDSWADAPLRVDPGIPKRIA